MNSLLESGLITMKTCGDNFAYVLADNDNFVSTEYKILQSKEEGVFIKCMKLLYNGRIQFYYIVSDYKPFREMIPSLDADSFMAIAANLFADIIDVKNYGFLTCRKIDASFEKIYVDPNTYRVKLIYLPSDKDFYPDEAAFENELRTGLVKLISDFPSLSAPKTIQFMSDLANGMYSMSDIYNRIKDVRASAFNAEGQMRLIAMNAPSPMEIRVTKDAFVIGKKAEAVDCIIPFNNKISRVHCRIEHHGNGKYSITDLQSTNGTFVNGVRLQAYAARMIKNGDIVRLADSDFQIVMGG